MGALSTGTGTEESVGTRLGRRSALVALFAQIENAGAYSQLVKLFNTRERAATLTGDRRECRGT